VTRGVQASVQPPPELLPEPAIRVTIAEDTFLMRAALENVVSGLPDIEVVGVYEDGDSLLDAIERDRPDAVVTDIRMPPDGRDEGIQIARALRETQPGIGVVVLSQYLDARYVLALLESGSAGRAYLLKERVSAPHELAAAIRAVVEGGSVVDPKVVEVLVQARSASARSPLSELTPREHEVLAELAQGKSNAAIAASMVLTKRAVEKHINAIFTKLGLANPDDVSRRVKAALMFLADAADEPQG
jgi:DNA-binding NarL/FixJ family response regulator